MNGKGNIYAIYNFMANVNKSNEHECINFRQYENFQTLDRY